MFNIGKDSTGIVVADGVKYELGYKDCLYITQGCLLYTSLTAWSSPSAAARLTSLSLWLTTAWTQLSSPSCPHTLSARDVYKRQSPCW